MAGVGRAPVGCCSCAGRLPYLHRCSSPQELSPMWTTSPAACPRDGRAILRRSARRSAGPPRRCTASGRRPRARPTPARAAGAARRRSRRPITTPAMSPPTCACQAMLAATNEIDQVERQQHDQLGHVTPLLAAAPRRPRRTDRTRPRRHRATEPSAARSAGTPRPTRPGPTAGTSAKKRQRPSCSSRNDAEDPQRRPCSARCAGSRRAGTSTVISCQYAPWATPSRPSRGMSMDVHCSSRSAERARRLPPVALAMMKNATLIAISVIVTTGAPPVIRPPNAVRGWRDRRRCPSRTQSGHWNPTDACRMQSGQIGRPHR